MHNIKLRAKEARKRIFIPRNTTLKNIKVGLDDQSYSQEEIRAVIDAIKIATNIFNAALQCQQTSLYDGCCHFLNFKSQIFDCFESGISWEFVMDVMEDFKLIRIMSDLEDVVFLELLEGFRWMSFGELGLIYDNSISIDESD